MYERDPGTNIARICHIRANEEKISYKVMQYASKSSERKSQRTRKSRI